MGVGNPFYVNRLIGLVPVEEDGSAHFEVPALRSLYFHALDADGKMLMSQTTAPYLLTEATRTTSES
jgi:hypothetical protein